MQPRWDSSGKRLLTDRRLSNKYITSTDTGPLESSKSGRNSLHNRHRSVDPTRKPIKLIDLGAVILSSREGDRSDRTMSAKFDANKLEKQQSPSSHFVKLDPEAIKIGQRLVDRINEFPQISKQDVA